MQITIDENHIYRVDGEIKPGTTDVIKQIIRNGTVSPYFNDFYSDRGHVIHEACALLALGRYKAGSIDPRLEGFIESADKALKKFCLKTEGVEEMFYDSMNGVCGTRDWRGTSPFWAGKKVRLDWKAGVKQSPDWELQGAAYVTGELWANHNPAGTKCLSDSIDDYVFIDAKLHQDGKCATLMPVTDLKEYINAWPHIAAMYYFKKKHGLLSEKEKGE